MRGTVPAGGVVPLHAYADPETFLMEAGELEALVDSTEGVRWVPVGPGDVFHIPGGARHAWRNPSDASAAMIIVSTVRIGRFFREVATRATPEHFVETAARYGYWNATPEENAAAGLPLPS